MEAKKAEFDITKYAGHSYHSLINPSAVNIKDTNIPSAKLRELG
jgi:hypothetical protein